MNHRSGEYRSTQGELTGELRRKAGEFPPIAVATQSGRTTTPQPAHRVQPLFLDVPQGIPFWQSRFHRNENCLYTAHGVEGDD